MLNIKKRKTVETESAFDVALYFLDGQHAAMRLLNQNPNCVEYCGAFAVQTYDSLAVA